MSKQKLKVLEMKVKITQLYPTLCDTTVSTIHEILQARILEWVAFPFSRGPFKLRDQTKSPPLQADTLPAEPQGKPKNTGVGSLKKNNNNNDYYSYKKYCLIGMRDWEEQSQMLNHRIIPQVEIKELFFCTCNSSWSFSPLFFGQSNTHVCLIR